ncbi:hypothetical protein [Streptomyces boninensis]|uniref:hypothetical protein n=1 Tax=Streptomyces boninensis TaxID=2039455 RepID=UPI003B225B06
MDRVGRVVLVARLARVDGADRVARVGGVEAEGGTAMLTRGDRRVRAVSGAVRGSVPAM